MGPTGVDLDQRHSSTASHAESRQPDIDQALEAVGFLMRLSRD